VLTGDLLERLEDLMGNVAILSAEMATLTRQHAACEFLLGAAEERLQGNFGTDEEHAKLYTQLLQLATTVDTETRKIWQVCSRGKQCTSGCQVHADAGTLDQFLSAQAAVSTCTPSGSAAVNFARAAPARAQLLDRQVTTLLAEPKQLQTELKCVQLCGALLRIPPHTDFVSQIVLFESSIAEPIPRVSL
jgi:hypothetical protein